MYGHFVVAATCFAALQFAITLGGWWHSDTLGKPFDGTTAAPAPVHTDILGTSCADGSTTV